MAEQLVAAADGEQDGAVVDRGGERLALAGDHVGGDRALVAVLAAADVDEVVGGRVEPLARARPPRRRSRSRATRSGAAGRGCCRGRRRCSSAPGRARGGAAPSGRPPRRTTVEPTWSSVGGISRRPAGRRPQLRRLVLELVGAERRELDLVRLLAQLAVGGDGLAQAADRRSPPASTRRRAAGSSRPSRRPRGRRAAAAARPRRRLGHRLDDRGGEPAAGGRCAATQAQAGDAARPAPPSSCSSCIGARTRPKLASSSKSRASPTTASHRQLAAARARRSAATSSGSRSRPTTVCPRRARCSATRPVPQPSSRTGPSAAAGQLLPERQVGGVGAALDVVPDRRRARAHRQNSSARPRSASSLRSSSRAV